MIYLYIIFTKQKVYAIYLETAGELYHMGVDTKEDNLFIYTITWNKKQKLKIKAVGGAQIFREQM